MKSPLEQFDIRSIKNLYTINIDLSLHNIYIPLFCIILCICIYIYINIYITKFISIYIQNIIELIYKFLNSLVKQQVGYYGLF